MTPPPLEAPAALKRIVIRCLAKQPRDRFPSMADVGAALEQAVMNPADQHPSIAVLPFANMSRDPDDEYFSDGLAEEIINLLAHIPGLKVTARTSSFAFRGKEQDIRGIAEALGVQTILEGSVRRAGSRIRVTAQFINAEDGYHLWSERYDRELTDVFAIQDEIAEAIAGALRTRLIAKPARYAPNFPAYEAFLKARHQLRTYQPEAYARPRNTANRRSRSIRSLPLPTHCWRSTSSNQPPTPAGPCRRSRPSFVRKREQRWNWTPPKPTRISCWPRSRQCTITTGRKPSGKSELPWPARLRQPRLTGIHACMLSTFGRFEESTEEMRRAVEKDPLSVIWRGSGGPPCVRRQVRRGGARRNKGAGHND